MFYQILVTYPTQELIFYSADIHLEVKKWDRKRVLQYQIPIAPQYQRVGKLSENPEQGMVR